MEEFFLNNLWKWKCGLPEESGEPIQMPSYESLAATEWCPEFEQYMRHRLIMGSFRYGLLGASNKPEWDRMGSIKSRAEKYVSTGNKEFLVDIANMCMLEFVEGRHPQAHFHALAEGEHAWVKNSQNS